MIKNFKSKFELARYLDKANLIAIQLASEEKGLEEDKVMTRIRTDSLNLCMILLGESNGVSK
jgi:hypothetical protein